MNLTSKELGSKKLVLEILTTAISELIDGSLTSTVFESTHSKYFNELTDALREVENVKVAVEDHLANMNDLAADDPIASPEEISSMCVTLFLEMTQLIPNKISIERRGSTPQVKITLDNGFTGS